MNYKIISNFLPEKDYTTIYNFFFKNLNENGIKWTHENIILELPNNNLTFLWAHNMWPPKKDFNTKYFSVMVPLLYYSNISNILRVRVNCYHKVNDNMQFNTGIHTDMEKPHKVLLYSINSNNGYTELNINNEKINIPSVANQALFFDGNIPHQAFIQTDTNLRMNINICYN